MSELSVKAVHQGGLKVTATARGLDIPTDYPAPGHVAEAPTSLELLLASLTTCAANGVALMLRRANTPFEHLEIEAHGQRRETHPTVLERIEMKLTLRGKALDPEAVTLAVEHAEHICPVWAMLRPGTEITTVVRILE